MELVKGGSVISRTTPSSTYKVGCDIYFKDAMKDGLLKHQRRPGCLMNLILGEGTSAHKFFCSEVHPNFQQTV